VTSYNLTDDEVLNLDGIVSREVQMKIDRIKRFRFLVINNVPPLIARVQAGAEYLGILAVGHGSGSCGNCAETGSFRPIYVRGPKKGLPNPNKPIVYRQRIEVTDFILCPKCYQTVKDNFSKLDFMRFENTILTETLRETLVVREMNLECRACHGMSWEFDIAFNTTLFPKGRYSFGTDNRMCPKCSQKEGFRARDDWFRVVPVDLLKKEFVEIGGPARWIRKLDAQARDVSVILEGEDGPKT
jgi:hypothetical protein